MIEQLLQWDVAAFKAINIALSNAFFDFVLPIMRDKYVWIPLYAFMLFKIYQLFKPKWYLLILLAILNSATADITSSRIIKKQVKRPRPCHTFKAQEDIVLRVRCGSGYSFTSSHATNHFAIAMFFGMLWSRYLWLLLLWAFVIAFSQIYVGVHYPIDIFAGTLLGIIIGFIYGKVGKHIIKKYIYTFNKNYT